MQAVGWLAVIVLGVAFSMWFRNWAFNRGRAKTRGELHPGLEANICLRNARLWTAHAAVCSGAARDDAWRAANAWTAAFNTQMRMNPCHDPVPVRPGEVNKDSQVNSWRGRKLSVGQWSPMAIGVGLFLLFLVIGVPLLTVLISLGSR